MSGPQAEELIAKILAAVQENAFVSRKHNGYFFEIQRDVFRNMVEECVYAATAGKSLQQVAEKAETEIVKDHEMIVETEFGVWERRRYEVARQLYCEEVGGPNQAVCLDQAAKAAVRAADTLIKELQESMFNVDR